MSNQLRLTFGKSSIEESVSIVFRRYYLYKLPRLSEAKGHMYAYITANAATEFWTVSELTVDDLNSIPGRTVSQAYFDPSETPDRLLVAYNDEPPNKKQSSNKGHLKGVLVADQRSGFWLVHSVPHYPNISGNLSNLLLRFT